MYPCRTILSSHAAGRWFLFYWRLAGVALFELTQLRPLLLIFPNTFEYFFIYYEAYRLRWDPRRMTKKHLVAAAAAILGAIARDSHPDAEPARTRCLDLIRRGQSDDGGWGAYVTSATEPFDTAVVVLALHAVGDEDCVEMINAGRDFLIETQLSDGSWPETTRPADRESYAHRVSTAAWCLQALVTVSPK